MSRKLVPFSVGVLFTVAVVFFCFEKAGQDTDAASGSLCVAPQVQADQPDYAPGSTVTITGCGFLGGEMVQLQVLHAGGTNDNDSSSAHQPWEVAADAVGTFQSTWLVPPDEDEF